MSDVFLLVIVGIGSAFVVVSVSLYRMIKRLREDYNGLEYIVYDILCEKGVNRKRKDA